MEKHYWRSLAERDNSAGFQLDSETEFAGTPLQIEAGPSRRGFLKAAGFTFGAGLLAGCRRAPVEKAMPYLSQPEGVTPGRPLYYASTCSGCASGCGVLVKTRDGRPVKLEGNPDHPVSRGGLCAAGQASILGLYDGERLKQPLIAGKPATWKEADSAVAARLASAKTVRFLTDTITSPTVLAAIQQFLRRFPGGRHVQYDAISCSAALDAHEQAYGVRALPRYRFDKAEVIVSFDADFLGTWASPVEYTAGWAAGRRPESGKLSWHVQVESRMSISGTKADRRVVVAPDEIGPMMAQVRSLLTGGGGAEGQPATDPARSAGEKPARAPAAGQGARPTNPAAEIAGRLKDARGKSIVVCGSQDITLQALAYEINQLLGNIGSTIDVERPSYQRQGSDRELEALLTEARNGRIDALFIAGANPLYDLPDALALLKVPLLIAFSERLDESAAAAHIVCPDHHPLESWSDAEPVAGVVNLFQPVIQPLGGTRPMIESLAAWSGTPKPAYDLVRDTWRSRVHPRAVDALPFEDFWERSVEAGYVQVKPAPVKAIARKAAEPVVKTADPSAVHLVLYPKAGMLDGRHAYNPWLHELPDPVTKITWDNYACVAPAAAARMKLSQGDVVCVEAGGQVAELPVAIQPGQHERVIAIALGYGSRLSARFANVGPRWLEGRPAVGENGLVGVNASQFARFEAGALRYGRAGVSLSATGKKHDLACTQDHHTLSVPKKLAPVGGEVRPIVQELTAAEWTTAKAEAEPSEELWPPDHPSPGHRWAMVVDLNACTGCSACVVACQVENNIPVVGKDEIHRHREMHWIRIDRYYSGAAEAPEVAHQPMMCQQCEHAGCETVCPVLATVHSEEGLNQQVYNRCVGTRYCANNCAYKARRFNWFEYAREDRLANMVLNPDVTVRSRGVMEKCTFCVQRIQEAKIEAKRLGGPVKDGDVRTACQQSCPAGAIVFGDLNDPNSHVAKLMRSNRRYRVLEEINARPSVGYLKVVRNRPEAEGGKHHG